MKPRYQFFDLLRGWALIIMIDAHVFNAFMKPELRNDYWFQVLNFINGLVAPAFLFVSGAVFYISTYGKTDELRKFGPSFRKKLYRIILIFLAGYSLHLPFLSLERMRTDVNDAMLAHFYSVDILQCIAVGLLLILLLKLLIKNEKLFIAINALLVVIIITVSPFVTKIESAEFLPLFLASYFTGKYGSLFPLFPWLSFLLAGVVSSYFFLHAKDRHKELFKYVFTAGAVIAASGFILLAEWFMPADIRLIRPNPIFIIQRMGFVLALLAVCWYYFYKKGETKSLISIVGMESLLVYWLHLQIIFRQFYDDKSIASIINNSWGAFESAAAWIILSLIMIAAAWGWNSFKKKYPKYSMLFVRTIVWVCVVIFLFT